jgi:hypothetical protein
MERMGPESLMLMAAAPIAFRPVRDDRALWELPMEVDRTAPTLLAASPLVGAPERPQGPRRLLAWLHLARGGARAGEF